jgi:hypothetical protein
MFELNGKQYSIEQLEAAADAQNITFEEFMEAMRAKGMVEVQPQEIVEQPIEQTFEDPFLQSVKKTYGPVEEAAAVGPEITAEQPDTELPSEDISLELPKKKVEEIISPIKKSKEFFSFEEEIGKKNLEKLYNFPNISFEETTATPTDDPAQLLGPLYNAVKIKYTDPKTKEVIESEPLQFATKNEKDIERNNKIISDFLGTYVKDEDYTKAIEIQNERLKKAFQDPNFKSTKDEIDAINKRFGEDMFEEKSETTIIPSSMYGATATSVTTKVKPYEAEVNAEIENLRKLYPEASNEQLKKKAKENVRQLQKELAFSELRVKKIEQSVLEAKEVDLPAFGKYGIASKMLEKIAGKEKQEEFQSEAYVNNLLATVKMEDVANKYTLALNTLKQGNDLVKKPSGATQKDYDTFTENLSALGIELLETGQDITLPNGTIVNVGFAKAMQDLHSMALADNEIYKGYSVDATDAAELYRDLALTTETYAKNYDLGQKYAENIGLGVSDIGFNLLYLGGKVLSLGEYASPFGYFGVTPFNDALDTLAVNYNKTVSDIRSSYVSDVNFDEAFDNPANFGRFAMQEVTNQIPILAAMMASGGAAAYVVGASSAGGKMVDMRTEIATGTADYNEAEMWLKSVGYGIAEGGFAALTTVPILNRAKATWAKNGKGSVVDNTSKQFIKDKSPGLIYEPLLESAGEIGTIMTQNMIDGNDPMLGADHAGFSGAAFGLLFSGIPFLKGLHTSRFSDYNADRRIRDLKTQIGKLAATRENLTSESAITEIDTQIKALSNDLANEINAQEDALKNLVTHKFGERITGIVEEQSNLKIQAKQTLDDTSLDNTTKQSIINRLQNRYDQLQNIKDTALSDTFKRKFEGEFKALEGTDKEAYDNYLSEAKETLYQEKNNEESTKEEIFRKAHDLYLLDKVQETLRLMLLPLLKKILLYRMLTKPI